MRLFNRGRSTHVDMADFMGKHRCQGSLALAALTQAEDGLPSAPLAIRPPHFPARVKRIIFMFMHGGPSQVMDRPEDCRTPTAVQRVIRVKGLRHHRIFREIR